MKKLGLCVRYDCDNYGSMLQIFATQEAIKKMGWSYEIILYDKRTFAFYIKNITRIFNPYFISDKAMIIKKKMRISKYKDIEKRNELRREKIKSYREHYIGPYSQIYKGYEMLKRGTCKYDAVMVGSDQLWTPAGIRSKFYNLLFVPEQIKKISFSTSFGVDSIPKIQRRLTRKYLERIDFLSVRELSGKKIIKELTKRDAAVTLDPTLLFNKYDWEAFFQTKKLISEPYIFAYFLGTNPLHRDAVEKLGREKKIKIVTCPHMDDFVDRDRTFGDIQLFDIDPIDFLNLIRGAEFICTDSFHGTVFSIIHNKKFLTFNRYADGDKNSKNSRIDSLCSLLEIESRRFRNIQNISHDIEQDIDYQTVDSKLGILREQTLSFLMKALTDR